MSTPEYWYPTAFSAWGAEEHAAIARVRASGQWTMGKEVATFECEFADYHEVKHGIMVNSGSSANLVAVAALVSAGIIGENATVTVPAIAWSTTYAPLVQHGIDLKLVDVDDTWNASNTEVACSILGNPVDTEEPLIEDNCESLGARDKKGHRCGTRGLLNTFSFFHSHQLSAIEGGMILTNDGVLADYCRMLRAHGWTRDVSPPKNFNEEYDFRVFGYNVRPLEMHAAIAREQLMKLPYFCSQREANLLKFSTLTHGMPITMPRQNGIMSPFGLAFTVKDGETRARLVKALRESGIDCRLPTGGSLRRHVYGIKWAEQQTPNADLIHDTGLFLGNAPFDLSYKIIAAVRVMNEVLK